MSLKKCSKCGELKELSEFYKDGKGGYRSECKVCKDEHSKQYREKNRDKELKKTREYREKNRDRYLKQQRKWKSKFAGNYIYMIIDTTNTPAYIGKTINIYKRINSSHVSGNVEATKELFLNNNVKEINYIEVSSIIENETELLYLEKYIINKYNGYLNTNKGMKCDNISKERQEELINKVEELIKENGWVLYKSYEVNYSIV